MVHSQDGGKVVLLQSGSGAGGASKLGPLRPKYKGVRLRSWGKWVSEIRIPNTRHKIWLGSYPSAHQAARAYDMAAVCLRGISSSNALNFPDSPPPQISTPGSLSPRSIQAVAAARASSPPVVSCSPPSGAGTPPLEKQEEESNTTITPPTSPHSSSDIPDIQATQSCGFLCLDCPHVTKPQGGMGCLDEDMSYFLDLEPLGFIPTSSLVTTYHAFQFDNSPSVDFQLWA